MRMRGKACLVTGGGSGIGRATSLLFAREGGDVAVADQSLPGATAVANAAGGRCIAIEADVANAGSVKAMIERTVETFGRLDVLVNNAGYGLAATVVDTDEKDWNRLLAVNLTGPFLACKQAIPIMKRQGGGVIVNTASVVAIVGTRNRAAYCASKGGLAALTRAMAMDHVGDGIRVNCVAPGTVDSPYFAQMTAASPDPASFRRQLAERQPMNRMGTPEEIAYSILYLACDESSYVTGTTLVVDGGILARGGR